MPGNEFWYSRLLRDQRVELQAELKRRRVVADARSTDLTADSSLPAVSSESTPTRTPLRANAPALRRD
jgi:hypothetical protein